MMLLEDQGKRLFYEHGIRVPSGRTVTATEQLPDISEPVMVKALVPAGGRGKSGGVRRAADMEELRSAVNSILGMRIAGITVRSVLVEEALPVAREMYLSISIDRSFGIPILIASGTGGMDVEALDESIVRRWPLHPFLGVRHFVVREFASALGLAGREDEVGDLLEKLWRLFTSLDCELVEINPLILTAEGSLVAADAKVAINDDSLFRHPGLVTPQAEGDELERAARSEGIAFVRLEGDIGVIANGAGLTMATLDSLAVSGGRVGAFMDLGGTDDPSKVKRAFEIMALSGQRVVLVNIFGAMTKCDTVAQGLLDALSSSSRPIVVVRVRGINEERAREMLRSNGINAYAGLEDAVRDAAAQEAAV
jgi:succinyl-CoA synthetase beta subunit